MYQVVTGVTSDVGVPSTYLVIIVVIIIEQPVVTCRIYDMNDKLVDLHTLSIYNELSMP